jgi:hypothetical protein
MPYGEREGVCVWQPCIMGVNFDMISNVFSQFLRTWTLGKNLDMNVAGFVEKWKFFIEGMF